MDTHNNTSENEEPQGSVKINDSNQPVMELDSGEAKEIKGAQRTSLGPSKAEMPLLSGPTMVTMNPQRPPY